MPGRSWRNRNCAGRVGPSVSGLIERRFAEVNRGAAGFASSVSALHGTVRAVLRLQSMSGEDRRRHAFVLRFVAGWISESVARMSTWSVCRCGEEGRCRARQRSSRRAEGRKRGGRRRGMALRAARADRAARSFSAVPWAGTAICRWSGWPTAATCCEACRRRHPAVGAGFVVLYARGYGVFLPGRFC